MCNVLKAKVVCNVVLRLSYLNSGLHVEPLIKDRSHFIQESKSRVVHKVNNCFCSTAAFDAYIRFFNLYICGNVNMVCVPLINALLTSIGIDFKLNVNI